MEKQNKCSECIHSNETIDFVITCDKNNTPRFNKPRSPDDADWGWRCNCVDFVRIGDGKTEL